MASLSSSAIAPAAFSSPARTGLRDAPSVAPTMMRASRSSRSTGLVASATIAITSLAGMMTKRSSRAMPFATPPSPITHDRSARSFMSIVRGQVMRRGSMRSALPCWRWLSSIAASRAWALEMA
jgi:hypothetical protein